MKTYKQLLNACKNDELQNVFNEVARYGKILVSLQNDTERYICFNYNNIFVETEQTLGECNRVTIQTNEPKYLQTLINN
jgi:hypothetical protein